MMVNVVPDRTFQNKLSPTTIASSSLLYVKSFYRRLLNFYEANPAGRIVCVVEPCRTYAPIPMALASVMTNMGLAD